MEIIYHRFRQAEYSKGVDRELKGTDLTVFDYAGRNLYNGKPDRRLFAYRDIGWEIDVVTGTNQVLGLFDLKWVMGFFTPSDALSPPEWKKPPFNSFKPQKRNVFLNQLNVEWRF